MRSITPPKFRKRKASFYVLFSIYVFLCAFILVESAVPGYESGGQSNWFSQIIANILNWFSGDVPAEIVEPIGVELAENGDSSLLGSGKIATGTTSLLRFSIREGTYSKGQTASREFRYEKLDDYGDNYDVLINVYVDGNGDNVTQARIVSKGEPYENCAVRFYAGTTNNVYYDYHFDVVELPAPNEGEYTVTLDGQASGSDYSLSVNESVLLDVTLSKDGNNDTYLRRYYDPSKLAFSSSNEDVATIDKNGRILGKEAGSAVISYGSYSFNITVEPSSISLGNAISITSEGSISENDYDILGSYVDSHSTLSRMEAANAISSGIVLSANIDEGSSDAVYTWEVVDENGNSTDYLGAKIVPLDGKGQKARLLGYRKGPGDRVYVKCSLAKSDGEIIEQISGPYEVVEITPASMEILGNNSSTSFTSGYENGARITLPSTYYSSKQLTLTGSFLGEGGNTNVTNKTLVASDYDDSALTVAGNNSGSINITFMKAGTYSIKISSGGNPELYYTLVFNVEATPSVDPNSGAFRSFIRKFLGHGSLFAVTAIFGMIFFTLWLDKENWLVWPTLSSSVVGLLVAMLSEGIQALAPERGPSWTDVGIDFLGYAIGTLVVFLIVLIVRLVRRRKTAKLENQDEEIDNQG